MDIIVGIRSHLAGLSALSSLVPIARIYTPILEAKATYPAIQLQLISDVDDLHLRGTDNLPTDRIQVDTWAKTRDQAMMIGRLVRQRLNGFRGTWVGTGSPLPTTHVQLIRYVEGSERFEPEINGGLCRHSADYKVTFRDSEEEMLTMSA